MIKRLFILIFIIFTGQLFAAEMIYAWGDGDTLSKTFTAVKFTFAHGDYTGIFKFALLIAVMMSLISTARLGMNSDMLSLPKMFAMSIGISTLFIVWRIDIVVKDVNTNQNYVVDQVPWAVAKPMIWFTGIEKTLGELMETSFAVPSDLTYSKSGFLSSFAIMDGAANAKIVDPYIFQSVDNFIIDCVAPDVQSGYYDITTLANSEDLWAEFSDTNPARVVYYFNPTTRQSQLETCVDAYGLINADLGGYVSNKGMSSLGSMLGGYTNAQISSLLGTSSNYFMGYSKSSSSFLMQSIIVNQFSDTYKNWASMNGMSNQAVAYGVGKGEQTAQANMVISGALGSKYLPVIKSILTVIIVALTPIVAILLLTPLFWKVLGGYLLTLIWLSLWHTGEIVLNFIILSKASTYMQGITDANGVYNLVTKPVVDNKYIEYVNMAGSMYWMIPTIAGVIVGGFGWMAFQGMTGGMTARVARGEGASMEVGSGEAKLGNITMGNSRSNQQMWGNNFSAGQNYNLQNTAGTENGYKSSNRNSHADKNTQVAGQNFDGNFESTTSGDKQIYSTFNGTNQQTKETWRNVGDVTTKDGKMYEGTIAIRGTDAQGQSYERVEKWQNGDLVKNDRSLSGEFREETTNYGGQFNRSIVGNGGKVTFDTNSTVVHQSGPVGVSEEIMKANSESRSERLSSTIGKTIEASKTGGHTTQSGIELVADAKYAAAKDSSHVSDYTRTKAINDIVNGVSSTAESYGQRNEKSFVDEKSTSDKKMNRMHTGAKLTASVDSDKALIGKLASATFGGKVGADASAGIENAWINESGVTFKMSDGSVVSKGYTEDFRRDHSKSVATGSSNSESDTFKTGQSRTDGLGASGKSGESTSMNTSMSKKESEAYAKELSSNYNEQIQNALKLQDQKALEAQILNGFLQENYKSFNHQQYGSGLEGMTQAYLAKDQAVVDQLKQYAQNYTGLDKMPSHVLNANDQHKLQGTGDRVESSVNGVMASGQNAFNEAQKVENNGPSMGAAKSELTPYKSSVPNVNGNPNIKDLSHDANIIRTDLQETKPEQPKMLQENQNALSASQYNNSTPMGVTNSIGEDPSFTHEQQKPTNTLDTNFKSTMPSMPNMMEIQPKDPSTYHNMPLNHLQNGKSTERDVPASTMPAKESMINYHHNGNQNNQQQTPAPLVKDSDINPGNFTKDVEGASKVYGNGGKNRNMPLKGEFLKIPPRN